MSARFTAFAQLAALASTLAACAPSVQTPPHAAPPSALAALPTTAPAIAAYVPRKSPDAPFRASPPAMAAATPFVPPPVRSFRLSNGVRVLLLEQHTPAALRVELILRTRPAPIGANRMAARGVWQGTKNLGQSQLQAANDADMAEMTTQNGPEWIRVAMSAPSDRGASSIARLADVALTPAFPPDKVVYMLREAAHDAETSDDAPRAIAGRVVPMALYGRAELQDEATELRSADFSALRRDDIASAYDAALDPSTAWLTVVGDTTEAALRPRLEKAFGAWRAHAKHPTAKAPPPALATSSPRLVVVDRPGPETLVTFAGAGPSYGSADWVPTLALQRLFNGPRGRATLALRDTGSPLTGSSLDFWGGPSLPSLTFRVEVAAGKIGELLTRVDGQMCAMKTAEVTPQELDGVLRPLALKDGTWTSTLTWESDALAGLVIQGLPTDALAKRAAPFSSVTPDDIRRVAARYLDPDRMKVVVVGDWAKLRDSLIALGWGPVEVRDAQGVVDASRSTR